MVTRRRIFYDVLREDYGYDVEVYLVDYRDRQASELHTGDTCQGIIKRMLDYSGFIEAPQGDFYFAMNDCASNTEFQQLRKGMLVEFIVSKLPNRDVRGSKGNGNAEEVAMASDF